MRNRPRPGIVAAFLIPLLLMLSPFCSYADQVEVSVHGIEGNPLENIRKMLQLPAGLIRENKVDEVLLNLFVEEVGGRVCHALEPFGYYHALAKVGVTRDGGSYRIEVAVDRGPPVRITEVHVGVAGPGATSPLLLHTVEAFPLHKGDILRQDLYEKAKKELQEKAVELGYLDADFPVHELKVRTDENTAKVDLEMETGSRYYFDGVVFAGTSSYPEGFLRRYLAFKAGEPFSFLKLGQTQVNLNDSQRFKSVLVSADRKEAVDHTVPVRVSLADAKSQQLRIGGGYGTDTGPRFITRYQYLNVWKKGHEFESALDVSQFSQGVAAKYIIPSAVDYRSFTAIKAAYLHEDVQTYTTSSVSLDIDRERSLGPGRTAGVFLRLLREQSDVGGERVSSFLVLPGVRFVAQRYDNLIRPRKGYRLSSELRGTGTFLGSDQTFLQSVTDGGFIHALSTNFTLFMRARVGWTLQREPLTDLPASLRFFAGGDKSVRGYAYQSLGPKDAQDNVVGGKDLFVGSVEVERAIGRNWGVAAFFDAGNAFDDVSRITLFRGTGLGVRYYSRFGPIKLDFARPLDKGYPFVRLHLIIGSGV